MAFPEGFPARLPSGRRSIRFFVTGTATAAFSDSAYLFYDDTGANPFTPTPYVPPGAETQVVNIGNQTTSPGSPMGTGRDPRDANYNIPFAQQAQPKPVIWCSSLRICNDGVGDLEFSFDGTIVHGVVKSGEKLEYRNRYEGGISVRGAGLVYRIESW